VCRAWGRAPTGNPQPGLAIERSGCRCGVPAGGAHSTTGARPSTLPTGRRKPQAEVPGAPGLRRGLSDQCRDAPRRTWQCTVVALAGAVHQHEDMSDHRFEQRGLLHVELLVHGLPVHVLVVHLGLIRPVGCGSSLNWPLHRSAKSRPWHRCWWRATSTTGRALVAQQFCRHRPAGLDRESRCPPFHHACRWRSSTMFLRVACKPVACRCRVGEPGGGCRTTCR
jgi:hypothetical protein